jgi:hypothetical protein
MEDAEEQMEQEMVDTGEMEHDYIDEDAGF